MRLFKRFRKPQTIKLHIGYDKATTTAATCLNHKTSVGLMNDLIVEVKGYRFIITTTDPSLKFYMPEETFLTRVK